MGDVMEVPGVTEEDLRRAAMARANRHCHRPPTLAAHEFTIGDWQAYIREEEGRELNESTAQRELDGLVSQGIMARTEKQGKRYDPRSQRVVVAYWYLEDGDGAMEGAGAAADSGRGPP